MTSSGRRIAAIAFPELLIEAALGLGLDAGSLTQKRKKSFGVISIPSELAHERERLLTGAHRKEPRLEAVSSLAERLGVRVGQAPSEARAISAEFEVFFVTNETVTKLLSAVVDVVQSFGTSVSMSHSAGAAFVEGKVQEEFFEPRRSAACVWIDVSGVAHLWGGEQRLAEEIRERVRLLGHTVRVAIAQGPEVARAIALYGPEREGGLSVVSEEKTREAIEGLPLVALPLGPAELDYFSRLGIFDGAALARLPRKTLASRLGPKAHMILDWLEGRDATPLSPYLLPESIEEKVEFENETSDLSPVLFALRGLLARLSARLFGRGRAAARMELCLDLAGGGRGVGSRKASSRVLRMTFELPTPLRKEADLFRVLKTRLEKVELPQAVLGLKLVVDRFEDPEAVQLSLGSRIESSHEAIELSLLLGELTQDLGSDRVGCLCVEESHQPEERGRLKPVMRRGTRSLGPKRTALSQNQREMLVRTREVDRVTRLFPEPIPLSIPLKIGASVLLAQELYTIKSLRFIERLDGVSWWEKTAVHRDYLWALFAGPANVLETLVYIDRKTGERFLQGLCD